MLSDERLNEIKERCEKATKPEDWWFDVIVGDTVRRSSPNANIYLNSNAVWISGRAVRSKMQAERDCIFAWKSRTDIPDLLAEIERLKLALQLK